MATAGTKVTKHSDPSLNRTCLGFIQVSHSNKLKQSKTVVFFFFVPLISKLCLNLFDNAQLSFNPQLLPSMALTFHAPAVILISCTHKITCSPTPGAHRETEELSVWGPGAWAPAKWRHVRAWYWQWRLGRLVGYSCGYIFIIGFYFFKSTLNIFINFSFTSKVFIVFHINRSNHINLL